MERNKADHIIVVEDDPEVRAILRAGLEKWGFRVTLSKDAKGFWELFDHRQADLVILDLNLPDEDGLSVCRSLRARSSVPVIILTGRSEEVERIIGLEVGADDYLAKPVAIRELVARIKSVLRRIKGHPPASNNSLPEQISFSGFVLESATRRLVGGNGLETVLTHGEFRLLQVFLQNPHRALSRDQLLDLTQRRAADPFDRSIDIQISRLRRALGDDPKKPRLIQTVRGQGYLFSAKVEMSQTPAANVPTIDRASISGCQVLVVDDDELSCAILENLLKQLGCRVTHSSSGEEGLALLGSQSFDLAMVDCYMPGLDGFETCRRFRAHERERGHKNALPMVAISSRSREEEHEKCVAAGMNDFLEKPVRLYQIELLLKRWLPLEEVSTAHGDAEAPLDWIFLRTLKMEVGADFPRLRKIFLDSMQEGIAQMEGAVARRDQEHLFSESLRLMGSSMNMGAHRLSRLCRDLSLMARGEDQGATETAFVRVRDESDLVARLLEKEDVGNGGRGEE